MHILGRSYVILAVASVVLNAGCMGNAGYVVPTEDAYDFGPALIGFVKFMEVEVRALDGNVTLEGATVKGGDDKHFNAAFVPGVELKPRERFDLEASFSPLERRSYSTGMSMVLSKGTQIGFPVSLTGRGVTAVQAGPFELVDGPVASRGETYRFGRVIIGDSRELDIKIRNTDSEERTGSIIVAGDRFSLVGESFIRIPAGATITCKVRFEPRKEDEQIGAVVIRRDGAITGATLKGSGFRRDE